MIHLRGLPDGFGRECKGPLAAIGSFLGPIVGGIGSAVGGAGGALGSAAGALSGGTGGLLSGGLIPSLASALLAPKAPKPPAIPPPPTVPAFFQGLQGGQNKSLAAQSPLAALGGTVSGAGNSPLGGSTGGGQKTLLGQ